MRAAASAASQPAWPAPTTTTSYASSAYKLLLLLLLLVLVLAGLCVLLELALLLGSAAACKARHIVVDGLKQVVRASWHASPCNVPRAASTPRPQGEARCSPLGTLLLASRRDMCVVETMRAVYCCFGCTPAP
jgi:hypothetical protein